MISAFFALIFLRALMMLVAPRFISGDRRDVPLSGVAQAAGGGR